LGDIAGVNVVFCIWWNFVGC